MDDQMKDVAAVPGIDLDRYLGTWFEICRLPLKWEDAQVSDITATYSKAVDGGIRVENRCLDKHGTPERSIGVAFPKMTTMSNSGSAFCLPTCDGSRLPRATIGCSQSRPIIR